MNFRYITLLSLSAFATARGVWKGDNTHGDVGEVREKSRVTAYLFDEHGAASIQCWEIGTLMPDTAILRSGGSSEGLRRMTLADRDSLNSVELHSTAPGTEFRASRGDVTPMFSGGFSAVLTTVKNGLLEIETRGFNTASRSDADDETPESHIFAALNGDDWIYFEDKASNNALQNKAPTKENDFDFIVRTRSGETTTTLNFYFKEGLEHKKLHNGACRFAGLKEITKQSTVDHDNIAWLRAQDL